MARYGVPYQGSKSKLADWVIDLLPAGDVLIDLMAGGCAITHAALLSDKWGRVIANDISKAPDLFVRAAKGEYREEKRWISREDFYRLKDTDEYVRLCWSFGNNGMGYLYSKEIEPWKKAVHFARVLGDNSLLLAMGIDSDGSRADIKSHHEEYKSKYIRWWLSQQGYSAMSRVGRDNLQRLQSLERLESLERLQGLETSQKDYREVKIPSGTVVYIDPPYRGMNAQCYGGFDFAAFDAWVQAQDFPVFISEYTAPAGCAAIAERPHRSTFGVRNNHKTTEKIFIQKKFLSWWEEKRKG
jgi:site-specific DNA-adenine methylase